MRKVERDRGGFAGGDRDLFGEEVLDGVDPGGVTLRAEGLGVCCEGGQRDNHGKKQVFHFNQKSVPIRKHPFRFLSSRELS